MNHLSAFFHDFLGARLHYQYWEDSSRSYDRVAVVLHGAGCHSGSYPELVAALVSDRWKVYALDFAGFGGSPGERGAGGARCMADAVEVLLRRIESTEGSRETALIAHSLGAVAALLFLRRYPIRRVKLALLAPLLFGVPRSVAPGDLAGEGAQAARIASDRLFSPEIPPALAAELETAAAELLADPAFLAEREVAALVGEADPFVPAAALARAVEGWPLKRRAVASYPRARHDPVGGEVGARALSAMIAWLGEKED